MNLPLKILLGTSILVAAAIGLDLFIPSLKLPRGSFFLLPMVLLLLGLVMIVVTLRQDIGGALRVFLILTGATPALFVISVLMHNVVSALGTRILHRSFEEPLFFLVAVVGCPLLFVVGAVGSIVLGAIQ